ncbi:conserved hypothetical protein [Carnobacterium maltaromaticum]|nr:conserved hypothetical protein [Carnobacterium maltaromaticum]
MKFRGGKKHHIKFPYSSFEAEQTQQAFNGAKRHNELFYQASSFVPTPREKDKNSSGQKTSYQFFLFS